MPPPESSPYRLVVEGADDRHSILHLMARHGYHWEDVRINRPFIQTETGIDAVLDTLPIVAKGRYERIGVVLDADVQLADRWAQIRGRLSPLGLGLPERPAPDGTIVDGIRAASRIGFWIMPDNHSPGKLEDFLARLVPPGDPSWNYAGEATHEARRRGARCRATDHIKGVIHTWLAWGEVPGLPFGTVLRARVFRHDTEDALRFVRWFHRLFGSWADLAGAPRHPTIE